MTRSTDEMAGVLCRAAVRMDRTLGREEIANAVGAVMKRHPLERFSDFQSEALHAELRQELILAKLDRVKRDVCGAKPAPQTVVKRDAPASASPAGRGNVVRIEKKSVRELTIVAFGRGAQ